MPVCAHCGGRTEWSPEVLSVLCTACGVLVDASQTVLETDAFEPGHSARVAHASFAVGPYLRTLSSDDARDARRAANTAQSHDYIAKIAGDVAASFYAERAKGIFDRVMKEGQYRWNGKAAAVACASIAVALRESNKYHSLFQIASVAHVSPVSITKLFTRIPALLKLNLPPSGAVDDMPTLHKHVADLLAVVPCKLPSDLQSALRGLGRTPLALASSLADLKDLPPGPHHVTACAVYTLAIEGARRAKLPNYRALSDSLAQRIGAGVNATFTRYRELLDWLHARVAVLPWAASVVARKGKRALKDPRDIVARALPDLLKFNGAIIDIASNLRPCPVLSIDPDPDADEDDSGTDNEDVEEQPRRKRKADALQSDPAPNKKAKKQKISKTDAALGALLGASPDGMAHHLQAFLLTCTDEQLERRRPPTRLDLLCVARGGEEHIDDAELFDDGELESIMRSSEERSAVWRVMHEDWSHVSKAQTEVHAPRRKRGEPPRTKATRGWEHMLDIALGVSTIDGDTANQGSPDDEDYEDGKADYDEEDKDPWDANLDDMHYWLTDY